MAIAFDKRDKDVGGGGGLNPYLNRDRLGKFQENSCITLDLGATLTTRFQYY